MANFTEKQIQEMISALKWDFGIDNNIRELAILELEDLKRKGCTLENIGECHGCSATKNGSECPLCGWEKRHPEYANDELAMRITVLEAGGEEAYKEKMKKREELHKKEDEAIQIAYSLKSNVIGSLRENVEDVLERYVQQRIHLALKYGKSTIDANS